MDSRSWGCPLGYKRCTLCSGRVGPTNNSIRRHVGVDVGGLERMKFTGGNGGERLVKVVRRKLNGPSRGININSYAPYSSPWIRVVVLAY